MLFSVSIGNNLHGFSFVQNHGIFFVNGANIAFAFLGRYVDGTLTEAETSSSFMETDEDYSSDKHRLEILPEAPLSGFALVKRVDETLNLTCHVVKAESGPFVKFQLEWYLPQHINNR